MGFVVDKVSEDSFYENLLLGLSKILEKSPCVSNVYMKRFKGVKQTDLRTWEYNNGVILPEDLRAFYSSCNGFLYTYEFSYDYKYTKEGDPFMREARIEINSLTELLRTFGYETKNVAHIEYSGTGPGKKFKLALSRESKVFQLNTVNEYAKVVLVYINSYSVPSIWLYSSPMSFNYIAPDFTTYFRMCLAHLGIPCWQYTVTPEGLPEWSREIFQLIAPGVLNEDRNLNEIPKYNLEDSNKIDPNIFIIPSHGNNSGNAALHANQQNKDKDRKSKNTSKKYYGKAIKKANSGT